MEEIVIGISICMNHVNNEELFTIVTKDLSPYLKALLMKNEDNKIVVLYICVY